MNRMCILQTIKRYCGSLQIVTVLLFAFLMISRPGVGCFNMPHEWIVIKHDIAANPCAFALRDALTTLKKRLPADYLQDLPVKVYGIFQGERRAMVSSATVDIFATAMDIAWPANRWSILPQAEWVASNSVDSLSAMLATESKFVGLTVQIDYMKSEDIRLLDVIFFQWTAVRIIYRESVKMQVRLVAPNGSVVLEEIEVSPTVVTDVTMAPAGSFFTYFSKRDSKPLLLDFGEIFPQAAVASRPSSLRMPNLPTSK